MEDQYVSLKNGWEVKIEENTDPDYPGISFILLPEGSRELWERFRVDFEWGKGMELPRLFVWNNPDEEDPTFVENIHSNFVGVE